MAEVDEVWVPDFRPGWPDVYPERLIVLRSMLTPPAQQIEDAGDDGEILDFVIQGSISPESPKFALVADLTVRDRFGFAGVTVLMPLRQREEPDELTPEMSDDLLRRYGEWGAALVYDFAATHLRGLITGSAVWFDVPFESPRPRLQAWNDGADSTTDNSDES